jgi:hypothetical protein
LGIDPELPAIVFGGPELREGPGGGLSIRELEELNKGVGLLETGPGILGDIGEEIDPGLQVWNGVALG